MHGYERKKAEKRKAVSRQNASSWFYYYYFFFQIIFATFDGGGVLNMLTKPHGCIQLREHFYIKLSHGQW